MQIRAQQGALPENAEKLKNLVDSRPFTHQVKPDLAFFPPKLTKDCPKLDLVFTAPEDLSGLLSPFQTSYYRTTVTFATLFSAFASAR
jgi:hypothetical protein